jgi:hypothetical protein
MFIKNRKIYFNKIKPLTFISFAIFFLFICLNANAMDYLVDLNKVPKSGDLSTQTNSIIDLTERQPLMPKGSDTESDGLYFLKETGSQEDLLKLKRKKQDTSSSRMSFQELGELYNEGNENSLTWEPIFFSEALLNGDSTEKEVLSALMLHEIDHDFFTQYDDFTIHEKSWQKKTVPYIRAAIASGLGIFVSMSITSQFIIHVGDWFGAHKDTSNTTALVTFIATMSSLMFANQWDNRIKRLGNYFWPARYMCRRNVNEELEKAAISESEKFKRTSVDMGHYVFAKGILLLTSGAYAIVPLWLLVNSEEAKDFPVTTCISGTCYFFSLADIFYQAVSLTPNPLTDEAARKRDLLIDHVTLFKKRKSDKPEIARQAYEFIKNALNTNNVIGDDDVYPHKKDFLFSALFLTPTDTGILKDFKKRYAFYNRQVESRYNPSLLDKRISITNTTNMALGISFLYLSVLLMEEYDVTLQGIKMPKDASYWTALVGAVLQSASFVYSTYDIHHSYTQKLVDMGTTLKKCFSYEWLTEKYQDVRSSCAFSSAFGWFGGKLKETASLATGVLLSSPQLKRALDIYSNLTPGMRFVQSLPPFILENSFLTNVFSKNLGEIKSKFLTSDFFYSVTSCLPSFCKTPCEDAHIQETLDLLCNGAIKQLKELNDETQFLLYYRILEHSGKKGSSS